MTTDHYFSATPSARRDPREFEVTAGQSAGMAPLRLASEAGTFSHGKLDLGTEVLLRAAPEPPAEGTFLDLGSGNGVLALTLARRSPAARVVAVEINERGRELTIGNAARNGIANVTVADPADVDPALRFDLIWSNPPIRVGAALHELLAMAEPPADSGQAILVVQKNLGADSLQRWLITTAGRRSASRPPGYRLLRVTAAPHSRPVRWPHGVLAGRIADCRLAQRLSTTDRRPRHSRLTPRHHGDRRGEADVERARPT